jgi:dipeptidyl aminopeptidase/acylaminoacyl peptidase
VPGYHRTNHCRLKRFLIEAGFETLVSREGNVRDWRYWRNLCLFGLCAAVLALTVGAAYLARRLALDYMHPPRASRDPADTPARYGVAFEDVVLITADGLELAAWYTPPYNGALILVAHGYADHRLTALHALLARHDYGVLSWDFRAHGESEGERCTLGFQEALDVEAALDFALSQPEVARVGAVGWSMGGVATILAAARRPEIAAVVVDSAFAAVEEELELVIRVPFLRPLMRFFAERQTGLSMRQLRPVDHIGHISPSPVLIIQGLDDGVIAVDSGRSLYNAAQEPRTLWSEPGVGHVGMYAALPDAYEARVVSFFDRALLAPD